MDVRTIPRSRYNPQFNRDRLASTLRQARIGYLHLPALGGLRHAKPDSLNTAWRNASFRGFADYMQIREFANGLSRLMKLGRKGRTAIMCAEALPWRCHRSLIADALLARGYRVEEIASLKRTRPHRLTPWARARAGRVTYPSPMVGLGKTRKDRDLQTMIRVKRVYQPVSSSDGARYLVERLWPRGAKNGRLRVTAWLKDVGPSTTLRRWFNHDPKKWKEFQRRYRHELAANRDAVRPILSAAQKGTVTLVYSSHDSEHNNAVALRKYVEEQLIKTSHSSRKSAA